MAPRLPRDFGHGEACFPVPFLLALASMLQDEMKAYAWRKLAEVADFSQPQKQAEGYVGAEEQLGRVSGGVWRKRVWVDTEAMEFVDEPVKAGGWVKQLCI